MYCNNTTLTTTTDCNDTYFLLIAKIRMIVLPSQLLLLKNKGHRGHFLPLTYDRSNMDLLHDSVELPDERGTRPLGSAPADGVQVVLPNRQISPGKYDGLARLSQKQAQLQLVSPVVNGNRT